MTAFGPVSRAVRPGVPVLAPTTTVADAARAMTTARRHCAAVTLADGRWGIVTDGDLRRRVLAAGLDARVPVSMVMTAPAHTVNAAAPMADAAAAMIAAGVRYLLVVDDAGVVLGTVDDTEVFAGPVRAGMTLRLAVARAASEVELVDLAAQLPNATADLVAARVSAPDTTRVASILAQGIVERAVELVAPDLPAHVHVLGSIARREAVPSSDIETAAVITDDADGVREAVRQVHELAARCGLRPDPHNALASLPRFARTAEQWSEAIERWCADPVEDQGVVMLSLLLDSIGPAGTVDLGALVRDAVARSPRTLTLMLREATAVRASMVLRDRLFRRVETADPKASILSAITDVGRWAGAAAGSAERSTVDRVRDGAAAGVLTDDDAKILTESYEVVQRIRLTHQSERIRAGLPPDDTVALGELGPLSRSLLAEAAREVAAVQRVLGGSVA